MSPSRTYRYEHQRREAAQRDAAAAAEREAARRASCGAEKPHSWRNWEYASDYQTEHRECRECGATESRPVRF